jgi:hypothetical protein
MASNNIIALLAMVKIPCAWRPQADQNSLIARTIHLPFQKLLEASNGPLATQLKKEIDASAPNSVSLILLD